MSAFVFVFGYLISSVAYTPLTNKQYCVCLIFLYAWHIVNYPIDLLFSTRSKLFCFFQHLDLCTGVTCSGNGACQPGGTCQCDPGYSGQSCEISKNIFFLVTFSDKAGQAPWVLLFPKESLLVFIVNILSRAELPTTFDE